MGSFEKENWTEERKREQKENIENSFNGKKFVYEEWLDSLKQLKFVFHGFNVGGKNNEFI